MKINRLETHDRLQHFKQDQSINIFQGAETCLKKNSLSLALQSHSPYIYIFAHPRTHDDGVTKVMFWQPRLTKPEAQTNSYLFRAQSHTDLLEICWMIPPPETWKQYQKGNVTENELVRWSINQFKTNKKNLEMPHPEDFSDEKIRQIYQAIGTIKSREKLMDDLYLDN